MGARISRGERRQQTDTIIKRRLRVLAEKGMQQGTIYERHRNKVTASGGRLNVRLNASQGEIYAPAEGSVKGLAAKVSAKDFTPAKPEAKSEPKPEKKSIAPC